MANIRSKAERNFRLVSSNSEQRPQTLDFNSITVDGKRITDNISVLTSSIKDKYSHPTLGKITKDMVTRALQEHDVKQLRVLSNFFFETDGIYSRLCRYLAYLYRYDYFITPIILDDKIKDNKVIEGWMKSAALLDRCNLKKTFGDIALTILKNGCYYGYMMENKDGVYLQELPADYCRSRYKMRDTYVVEFNVKYFDECFRDIQYRLRVLRLFPKEIQRAYVAFKKGTLKQDYNGDDLGWVLLNPDLGVKFAIGGNGDVPFFAAIIPALMDLDEAQELDKEKMKQQLLRIIIQKMPIDKNGDLIFDLDESRALHNNAVKMLGKAIGVNVLTTFADVDVADMSDKSNVSSVDQLDKVERTVYNEAGVSQMQFNTSGNLALEKSIANDEATMTSLLLQFEAYANALLKPFNKNPKRLLYKVQMLPTTIYNYKDLSKIYKEQTQIGFSKLLPQVALGHSQLAVMSTAYFENKLMNLDELFVAPQMSSTMSNKDNNNNNANQENEEGGEPSAGEEGGRPELPEDEKSEKTIQNEESGQ